MKRKKLYIGIFISIGLIMFLIILGNSLIGSLNHAKLDGKSAPVPTIKLNGSSIDHIYENFCWNEDCSQIKHNPPSIPTTDVKSGDHIEISWGKFKKKPNKVILYNIMTGETIIYHLKDTDIEIVVPKQANPYQYDVLFQWYIGNGNELRGESSLSFKVKAS